MAARTQSFNLIFILASFLSVLSLAPTYLIKTTAGKTGSAGNLGDGGQATSATMSGPLAVWMKYDDSVMYVSDNVNNRIRQIDMASNVINIYSGRAATADSLTTPMVVTSATMNGPCGIWVDPSNNNLYFIEKDGCKLKVVISGSNTVTRVVGNGCGSTGDGGYASSALISAPAGIIGDTSGKLYISDFGNSKIRVIILGIISTYFGTGTESSLGDGSLVTAAGGTTNKPWSVGFDPSGNLYWSEAVGKKIRAVSASTQLVSTIDSGLSNPNGMIVDLQGNVIYTDQGLSKVRARFVGDSTFYNIAGKFVFL